MSHIPQPKPVQLDYFDPNIVVGIVEESESLESAEKEGRKVKNNNTHMTSTCNIHRRLKDDQNLLLINLIRGKTIR